MRYSDICVMGMGYIGLPTASTFAMNGVRVYGVDINQRVVHTLQNGKIHIHEPGLRSLVNAAIGSGSLTISDQPHAADAFIIAVPTPFIDGKKADLSFVESATNAIIPLLKPGNLVVLESTSPPRTTIDTVAPILEKSGLSAGKDFYLAYSPERVLPGHILRELVDNDRIIGGVDRKSAEAARDLYRVMVRGDIVLTDSTSAEMVKLMENTSRDVNIAIANEFSRLAERFGLDVWEAIELANRHPRINILQPGPGVGGHCISVDPWFLVEKAPDLSRLIKTAREVNDSQPAYVVDFIQRKLGDLDGRKICLLGLAYKPDVDDLRESPSVEIALLLTKAGVEVVAYDPLIPDASIPGVRIYGSVEDAIGAADTIVLLVAHTQLKELEPGQIESQSRARIIIDAVNGWSQENWEQHGFEFFRLGVGNSSC